MSRSHPPLTFSVHVVNPSGCRRVARGQGGAEAMRVVGPLMKATGRRVFVVPEHHALVSWVE